MRYFSFKIFPSAKKKWYYTVHIFYNKSSMYTFRKSLDKDGADPMPSHTYAACCSVYNSTRKGEERQYGVLLFTQASARKSGIVAHEICHALTYWWKCMEKKLWVDIIDGKRDRGAADERHAWLLGYMVSQFWRGWYKMQDLRKKKT